MLVFLNSIYQNNKAQVDVIYLDFAKAFDRVPTTNYLPKIWSIGITKDLWSWFKSHLHNRYQCIRINGSSSDHLPVLSRVNQTSILIGASSISNLHQLLDCLDSVSHMLSFADNTKCFKTICDWIWENSSSTHTTARYTIHYHTLYTLANISGRYQCWKLPRLLLLWLVSESCQTSMSAGLIFEWVHLHWTSASWLGMDVAVLCVMWRWK